MLWSSATATVIVESGLHDVGMGRVFRGASKYHEDIAGAIAALREREPASNDDPVLLRKLPQYWSQAAFLDAQAGAVRRAVAALPDPDGDVRLVFTARSIHPVAGRRGGRRRAVLAPGRAGLGGGRRPLGGGRDRRAPPSASTTTRCGSRARVRRRCRGSNPTSPITCGHWRYPQVEPGRRRAHRIRLRPPRSGVGPRQRTCRIGG